jgi:hypothetical protein
MVRDRIGFANRKARTIIGFNKIEILCHVSWNGGLCFHVVQWVRLSGYGTNPRFAEPDDQTYVDSPKLASVRPS